MLENRQAPSLNHPPLLHRRPHRPQPLLRQQLLLIPKDLLFATSATNRDTTPTFALIATTVVLLLLRPHQLFLLQPMWLQVPRRLSSTDQLLDPPLGLVTMWHHVRRQLILRTQDILLRPPQMSSIRPDWLSWIDLFLPLSSSLPEISSKLVLMDACTPAWLTQVLLPVW